jgi:hypothetical protein
MKKMQLPRVHRAEAGEQSLRRDDVLDEVDVAIEVKAERFCTYSSHRHDRSKVPCFAAAHHRHRGAVTRRLRNTERQIGQMDRVDFSAQGAVGGRLREEQAHVCSVASSIVQKRFDEQARVTEPTL